MKKLFLSALLCATSLLAFAEAGPICDGLLGNETATAGQYVPARVKWTTDAYGNVDITIMPYNKAEETTNTPTAWRGRGMADDVTNAKGWGLTIDGVAAEIANYFTKNYSNPANQASASKVYQLQIKADKKAELDAANEVIITFSASSPSSICWWTPRGNNAYAKYAFEYLYGSICEDATLAAPQNVAVAGNVLTFDAVEGAESYDANIYLNGTLVKSIAGFTSGSELTRPMHTGATYTVKVVAKAGAVESDESAEATWVVANDPQTVGASEYCDAAIGSGASLAGMTWQTIANGDIVISISGDEATWRSTAFKGISYFKVGEVPASVFFEEVYTTGSTEYTLHLINAAVAPVAGEVITFFGTPQWKTASATNAYVENVTYTYTYTAGCAGMDAPQNVAVSADSVITFDAVTGASSYVVTIYLNDEPVKKIEGVQSGDVLHFTPLASGTYNVTVYAVGDGALDSDESAAYAWELVGTPWTPTMSTICGLELLSDTYEGNTQNIDSSLVEISIITRNDSVIATIRPVIENDTVSWRGNEALKVASFRVNGMSATRYFTCNSKDKDTVCVLVPKAGVSLPHGTVLEFFGSIPWRTRWNTNAYKENYSFSYVYGSDCEETVPPVGTGVESVEPNAESLTRKVLINGQLFIIRDERMFDALGREIK